MPWAKDNPKNIAYRKAYQKRYAQLEREKARKREYMRTYSPSEEQKEKARQLMLIRERKGWTDLRANYYTDEKIRDRFQRRFWSRIKKAAEDANVPFDLTLDDLVIPKECPIFHIPLTVGTGVRNHNTPSVDRIIPRLGYVKGNVQIISWKANRMKNDGSFEDLIALGEWAKTQLLKQALNG